MDNNGNKPSRTERRQNEKLTQKNINNKTNAIKNLNTDGKQKLLGDLRAFAVDELAYFYMTAQERIQTAARKINGKVINPDLKIQDFIRIDTTKAIFAQVVHYTPSAEMILVTEDLHIENLDQHLETSKLTTFYLSQDDYVHMVDTTLKNMITLMREFIEKASDKSPLNQFLNNETKMTLAALKTNHVDYINNLRNALNKNFQQSILDIINKNLFAILNHKEGYTKKMSEYIDNLLKQLKKVTELNLKYLQTDQLCKPFVNRMGRILIGYQCALKLEVSSPDRKNAVYDGMLVDFQFTSDELPEIELTRKRWHASNVKDWITQCDSIKQSLEKIEKSISTEIQSVECIGNLINECHSNSSLSNELPFVSQSKNESASDLREEVLATDKPYLKRWQMHTEKPNEIDLEPIVKEPGYYSFAGIEIKPNESLIENSQTKMHFLLDTDAIAAKDPLFELEKFKNSRPAFASKNGQSGLKHLKLNKPIPVLIKRQNGTVVEVHATYEFKLLATKDRILCATIPCDNDSRRKLILGLIPVKNGFHEHITAESVIKNLALSEPIAMTVDGPRADKQNQMKR